MRSTLRRITFSVGLAITLLVLQPRPVPAIASSTTCFQNYWACVNTAANISDFIGRSIAGLDCAVDLVSCVRHAIFD